MMTGQGNEFLLSHSFRHGADDYLRKDNLSSSLLEHSIDHARNECKKQFQKDLKILELEMTQKEKLDLLTGLPNREALEDSLRKRLKNLDSDETVNLIFLDVEGFTRVNDRKGFLAGDALLKHIGGNLTRLIQEEDFLGRYGNDEFCVITHQVDSEEILQYGERLQKNLEQSINGWLQKKDLNFSSSVNLVVKTCKSTVNPSIHLQQARKLCQQPSVKTNQ
jgi:diguanylate cyclase (GGDEF)-like protein